MAQPAKATPVAKVAPLAATQTRDTVGFRLLVMAEYALNVH